MRDIKFRAWNKVEKWLDGVWLVDLEHELLCFTNHNQDDLQNYILMQFTGLKDKNGKEIFEGDLVKYHDYVGGGHDHYRIVWDHHEWKAENTEEGSDSYISSRCEITGNIYEQQMTLIDKKKDLTVDGLIKQVERQAEELQSLKEGVKEILNHMQPRIGTEAFNHISRVIEDADDVLEELTKEQ